jgi:hypothetical protein
MLASHRDVVRPALAAAGAGGMSMPSLSRLLLAESRRWRCHRPAVAVLMAYLVLLGGAVITGVGDTRAREERQQAASSTLDQAVAHQRARAQQVLDGRLSFDQVRFSDPVAPYVVGAWLVRPPVMRTPAPLAPLGSTTHLGIDVVQTSIWSRRNDVTAAGLEDPGSEVAGAFSATFVVMWLLPLVLLALDLDLVALDREQRVWTLVLAQVEDLRALVLTRTLVRWFVVVAPTIVMTAAATLPWMDEPGAGWALLAWSAAVAAYGLFWSTLIAWMHRGEASTGQVALRTMGCWLVLVILVPAMAHALATRLQPPPDRLALVLAMRSANQAIDESAFGAFYRDYYAAHPDQQPADGGTDYARFRITKTVRDHRMMLARFILFDRALEDLVIRQDQERHEHHRCADLLASWSPPYALQRIAEDLTGGSAAHQRRFLAQADAFRAAWRRHFAPMIMRKALFEPTHYDQLPATPCVRSEPEWPIGAWVSLVLATLLTVGMLGRWRP